MQFKITDSLRVNLEKDGGDKRCDAEKYLMKDI